MRYIATVNGKSFPIFVDRKEGGFIVEIDGKRHSIDFMFSVGSSLHSMIVGGKQYEVVIEKVENGFLVYIDGESHLVQITERLKEVQRKDLDARIEIKAAMPGLVVALEVQPGQTVKKDDGLLVLEAMKMQNEVKAPREGVVREVHIKEGSAVEKGEKLVTIQT